MIGGHGHVTPRPDGAKARCGGPGLCAQCSQEQARKQPEGKREQRVLLVKPGDLLLVGNAGELMEPEISESLGQFCQRLGVNILLFEADIEIGRLTPEQVIDLARGDGA